MRCRFRLDWFLRISLEHVSSMLHGMLEWPWHGSLSPHCCGSAQFACRGLLPWFLLVECLPIQWFLAWFLSVECHPVQWFLAWFLPVQWFLAWFLSVKFRPIQYLTRSLCILKLKPPFKPNVRSETDTRYFDEQFTREPVHLTPPGADGGGGPYGLPLPHFESFSYSSRSIKPNIKLW